jgi:hypothetical protein
MAHFFTVETKNPTGRGLPVGVEKGKRREREEILLLFIKL